MPKADKALLADVSIVVVKWVEKNFESSFVTFWHCASLKERGLDESGVRPFSGSHIHNRSLLGESRHDWERREGKRKEHFYCSSVWIEDWHATHGSELPEFY